MPINVTLGTNDLEISDANGDVIDTIAYQSIDTIAYVNNPGTVVNSSTLGAAPTVTGDPQWSAVIWLRDGRKAFIMLGDVDNQAGWINDQTGFDALVADIYAAFPVAAPGSGTVTTFSFTDTADVTGTVATATTTPALTITAVASTRKSISQAAHGFAVGDWLKRSSGSYAKAQADSAANAEVVGVVGTVTNANTFVLATEGVIEGLSGLTDATTYFLSPTTAGAITSTDPSTVGQVSKPVLLATSTTTGIVANMRGMVITAPVTAPYSEYMARFDDMTVNPPTGTGTNYNTVGTITPARSTAGIYTFTSAALFTSGKTFVSIEPFGAPPTRSYSTAYQINSTSVITVYVSDNTDSSVDPEGLQVTIKVTP